MRIQLWQSKAYPSKDHNFDEKPDNVLADITKSMYNVLLVKQLIREL